MRAGRVRERPRAIPAADSLAVALRGHPGEPDTDLTELLIDCAAATGMDADALSDAVAVAATALGPRDADPNRWDALIALARSLQPSGWWVLQPSPLFTTELVAALVEEAAADPLHGPILSALAVDQPVLDAAAAAVGRPFASSGYASYRRDEPGTAELPHLDRAEYPFVLHVLIEHDIPTGGTGSNLLVHDPEETRSIPVGVGDGVLLAGRGTLHEWQCLDTEERRTVVSIGLV